MNCRKYACPTPATSYTFNALGLDVAGLSSCAPAQAAGGIGGMRATCYAGEEGIATAVPMPDRNGNTRALVGVTQAPSGPECQIIRYDEDTPTGQLRWTGRAEQRYGKLEGRPDEEEGVVYPIPEVPAAPAVALAKRFAHGFGT